MTGAARGRRSGGGPPGGGGGAKGDLQKKEGGWREQQGAKKQGGKKGGRGKRQNGRGATARQATEAGEGLFDILKKAARPGRPIEISRPVYRVAVTDEEAKNDVQLALARAPAIAPDNRGAAQAYRVPCVRLFRWAQPPLLRPCSALLRIVRAEDLRTARVPRLQVPDLRWRAAGLPA